MKTFASPKFIRNLTSLIKSRRLTRTQIDKTLDTLSSNPSHPSLRLHKLSGTSNYAVSVTKDIRIIFNREKDMLYLSRIGSHDEVY